MTIPKKLTTGLFIVLESNEGAGKSTQTACLNRLLTLEGYDVVTTREPGGSPGAEEVRRLLVTGEPGRWDGISELLMFSAARRNHVETLIKPAIAAGKIVISDRFVPSTFAYQGCGRGMDIALIKTVTQIAIGEFKPDLTFILDIPVELGLHRSRNLRKNTELRFETEDLAFHRRVRDGYLAYHMLHAGSITNPCILQSVMNDDGSEMTAEVLSQLLLSHIHAAISDRQFEGVAPVDPIELA